MNPEKILVFEAGEAGKNVVLRKIVLITESNLLSDTLARAELLPLLPPDQGIHLLFSDCLVMLI